MGCHLHLQGLGVRLQCNTAFKILQVLYTYYSHRTGNSKILTQIFHFHFKRFILQRDLHDHVKMQRDMYMSVLGRGGVVTVTVYNSNKRDRTSVPTSSVEPVIKSKEVY